MGILNSTMNRLCHHAIARTLFLSFCFCAFLPLYAQTSTTPYQPGITTDGAIYMLPKTAIRVTVRSVKRTYTPGDFCKYAQRYLRLNNVSIEPSVVHELISVTQTPIGIADSTKAFAVKFDARTVAANVALSDDGTLLAINAAPKTSLTTLFTPFTPAVKKERKDPHQFLNEEILAAGSTAKMAELTAQEIYDLRESRSLLIKGQADFMPKDGEQLRLMLSQLSEQDEALTSLFSGIVECDTTEQSFLVVPNLPIRNRVVFRFSSHFGVVAADDLSGAPYSISVERLSDIPDMAPDNGKKKKLNPKGIYVNVPSKMRSTLFSGNDIIDTSEMPAPQFGYVELLSDQLFNKRYTTHLWLNPVSGAVDKLEAEQPK